MGIFIVILVGLMLLLPRVLRKTRARDLTSVAESFGFIFLGNEWPEPSQAPMMRTWTSVSSQPPLFLRLFFKRANKPLYSNIMSGSFAGLPVSLFDYRYSFGRQSFPLTVVAFSHGLRLPMFQLLPNHPFLPTLLRETGAKVHAIVFDSHPDFSRRFLLIGAPEDEAELRALFSPALLAFLAGLPPQELWSIENDGVHLILHGPSIVRTRDFRVFLEQSSSIAKTFLDSRGAITAGQISASSKSSGIDRAAMPKESTIARIIVRGLKLFEWMFNIAFWLVVAWLILIAWLVFRGIAKRG
jgi:hypothetical protein